MKRIIAIFFALFLLASCSLQEAVSPEIFTQRLCKADENIVPDDRLCFYSENVYTFYFSYADCLKSVAEIHIDEQGNAKKINLACSRTDKIDLFIQCVKSFISVYSPTENSEEIITALFEKKTLDSKFSFYETQWYIYSVVLSENGLYFSTESKKLSPQSEVELSLKSNDIVEY